MANTQYDKQRGSNGQPKPGQPRPVVVAALASQQTVIEHAKEIMDQLIPLRRGMTADGIAAEAFELARAFAAEAKKDAPPVAANLTGVPSDV